MSSIILTIGLSTWVQVYLGHRMAMISGPNVIPSLAIVAAITAGGKEYAQQAFLAQSIAGILVIPHFLTGAVLLGIASTGRYEEFRKKGTKSYRIFYFPQYRIIPSASGIMGECPKSHHCYF